MLGYCFMNKHKGVPQVLRAQKGGMSVKFATGD